MDLLPQVQENEQNIDVEIEDQPIEEHEPEPVLPEITEKEQIQVDEVFKKAQDLPAPVLKKVKRRALICDPSTSASVIIIIFPYLKSFKSISCAFGSKPKAFIKVTISFEETILDNAFVLWSDPFPLPF